MRVFLIFTLTLLSQIYADIDNCRIEQSIEKISVVGQYGNIWLGTDDASTWETFGRNVEATQVTSSGEIWAFSSLGGGKIYYLENSENNYWVNNWRLVQNPIIQIIPFVPTNIILLSVSSDGNNVAAVATSNKIYVRAGFGTGGGAQWTSITHNLRKPQTIQVTNSGDLWATDSHKQLWYLKDGTNWQICKGWSGGANIKTLSVSSDGSKVAAITTSNEIVIRDGFGTGVAEEWTIIYDFRTQPDIFTPGSPYNVILTSILVISSGKIWVKNNDQQWFHNLVQKYKLKSSGKCTDEAGWGYIPCENLSNGICTDGGNNKMCIAALKELDLAETLKSAIGAGTAPGCVRMGNSFYFQQYANVDYDCSQYTSCMCTSIGNWAQYKPTNVGQYLRDISCGDVSVKSTCVECLGGFYTAATGCLICDMGRASVGAQDYCPSCNPGFYQDVQGGTTCKKCDAGYGSTSSAISKLACGDCPKGKSSVSGGGCTACSAGTYQDQTTQSVCKLCPAGYFATGGALECTECGRGTVNPNTGSTSLLACVDCVQGKYASSLGMEECIDCEKGRAQSSSGEYTCIQCDTGKYQDQKTQTSCKDCVAGKWSARLEQTTENACKSCPTGKYSTTIGASYRMCITCPAGKHQPSAGATDCLYCPVGQYKPTLGEANCIDCDARKVTGVSFGALTCDIVCLNGYQAKGQAFCAKCPEGKYLNDADGDSTCKQCSSETPKSNGTLCYICLPGHHRHTCSVCPVGRYTGWEQETLAECRPCENGYQDEEGSDNCKTCPAGRISSASFTTCVTCPLGEYSDAENLIECKRCPSNEQHTGIIGEKDARCTTVTDNWSLYGKDFYTTTKANVKLYGYQASLNNVILNQHTTFPTTCGVNEYQNTFPEVNCKKCPDGLYKEGSDTQSLNIVGPNDFNVCRFCPEGRTYTSSSSSCTNCDVAVAVNKVTLKDFPHQECRSAGCPKGSFARSAECFECPAGTYWESEPVIGIEFQWDKVRVGIEYEFPNIGIFHECSQFETQLGPYWNVNTVHIERFYGVLADACLDGYNGILDFCFFKWWQDDAKAHLKACEIGKDLRAAKMSNGYVEKYRGLCRSCPAGQYQDLTGQDTCKSCSAATATLVLSSHADDIPPEATTGATSC